ncbi:Histone acetyltransferase [Actinidia chinensis var. chinensis]|uniref:Histone acetyltransferase n=1 Tax=Actinidia chinensis var. chinensis TaxID=1590841 RepID=A0A2R6PPK9_ACTCC|nr:Histone acetyltransferase [Actinidia chinensis var. chinensis]
MYGGLKRYWKRKGYERLNGSGSRRKTRVELGRTGSGSHRRRRFWRIKITPRLRFNPRKFLMGLRDAYVNFMLRIANTRVMSGGYGGAVDPSFGGFGRVPLKEYDEKMIVQIYSSLLMAQAQRVPCDAAKLATQIGSTL